MGPLDSQAGCCQYSLSEEQFGNKWPYPLTQQFHF